MYIQPFEEAVAAVLEVFSHSKESQSQLWRIKHSGCDYFREEWALARPGPYPHITAREAAALPQREEAATDPTEQVNV